MPKKNNFVCNGCGNESFVSAYRTSFKNGEQLHKDEKTNKLLMCCDKPLTHQKITPKGMPSLATFGMMSVEQKRASLVKRSKDHSKIHIQPPQDD